MYQVIDDLLEKFNNNEYKSQQSADKDMFIISKEAEKIEGGEEYLKKQIVKQLKEKMSGWSRTQEKKSNNLKSKKMSTETKEAKKAPVKKTPIVGSTKEAKKAPVKKAKKAAVKAPAVKTPKKVEKKKGPGVIASILEFVQSGPIKESDILKKLSKRFPDRDKESMSKTIKAQIGSNKRPVRMEREKNLTFVIEVNEKKNEKTYSVKK